MPNHGCPKQWPDKMQPEFFYLFIRLKRFLSFGILAGNGYL
jgi:hypothetical protein